MSHGKKLTNRCHEYFSVSYAVDSDFPAGKDGIVTSNYVLTGMSEENSAAKPASTVDIWLTFHTRGPLGNVTRIP